MDRRQVNTDTLRPSVPLAKSTWALHTQVWCGAAALIYVKCRHIVRAIILFERRIAMFVRARR